MHKISESVVKKDHQEKMSGKARYIADLTFDGMLHAKIVRSTKAHAKIKEIKIPNLAPEYMVVDYKDVPGENLLKVVTSEQPIFAEEEVRFIGEAILMVVGPNEAQTRTLAEQVEVIYEDLPAVLTIEEAYENAAEYRYEKGNIEEAFRVADQIIEETFASGYQEQAYIEPQGAIGIFQENKMTIYGSMQCPYYVKEAVAQSLALKGEQVQIIQATTGGAFGGKEDYPSLLGCQVGVAAKKIGKPVRLILNRREDMAVTPKRHPSKITYRTALDEKGTILGMDVDIALDAGAYAGLSSVVLQRSMICASGVYRIAHIRVHGKACLTNTVPNGAYRGFGAPQSFFALETHICHIAKKLAQKPLEYKKKYLVKKGDETSTKGIFHEDVKLEEMIAKAEEISGYPKKKKDYEAQEGRYRKGIGMSIFFHGCGFTGNAERDYIKSVAKLVKYKDETVEILVSNTDMGQGLKTTLSKVVAETLEIPLAQVFVVNPDTDRVPNTGPTVASRSLMIAGKLLERAAKKLKEQWSDGEEQEIVEHYVHPDLIPWDMETFSGDAYPTYSWGVNVVEVQVDTRLALTELTGAWTVFDVGTAIDHTIMMGQIEGGMLQGLGYASSEYMCNQNGKIRQASMTDYIIPTAMDTVAFHNELIDNPYQDGPFGAKGAGELTLIGVAPAYVAAMEDAVKKEVYQIPITPERLMEVIQS